MKSPFTLDYAPPVGVPLPLRAGLQVVTAPNASPMTFRGTNSYILGDSRVAIIDPGPDDDAHFRALMAATRGREITHILVTHSHIDHSPLARRFDAPVYGFGDKGAGRSAMMTALAAQGGLAGGEGVDHEFSPDIRVADGQVITGDGWTLEALHTPGHMANHLCFAWEGALFSGDHVMGWSTTLVSPPDGDLTQFMASLRALQDRSEDTYFPGHGAVLENAQDMLAYQLAHRLGREDQILAELATGPNHIPAITKRIYADLDAALLPMARRNVFSHLIDLSARGIVTHNGPLGVDSRFELAR